MAMFLGNKRIEELYLGSDRIAEAYLGADLVYSSDKYIFHNGVLIPGATLNNLTMEPEGEIGLEIYGGYGSGQFDKMKNGYIQLDVTNYSKIIVKGRTWCYGLSTGEHGDNWPKTMGLDVSSVSLPQGYRGWTGNDGEPAAFSFEFNSSVATGMHRIVLNMRCRNESSNWLPADNTVRITEIIGEH